MQAKIFFDTSFYVAINHKSDSLHHEAIRLAQTLTKFDHQDYTSNFVLLETLTVLSQKENRLAAILFRDNELAYTNLIRISAQLENKSWEIFKQIKNKNISYVDCSILAVIKNHKIDQLVTFDKHFQPFRKEYNFTILPIQ